MHLDEKVFHAYCVWRQFALVHLSLEEAAVFVCQGFCDQGIS